MAFAVIDKAGASLPFKARLVSTVAAFRVYRVAVKAGSGFTLKVAATDLELQKVVTSNKTPIVVPLLTADYQIDKGWKRPVAGPTEIEKVEESSYVWTCSYEQLRRLILPKLAPAFRVEWATTRDDYLGGKRRAVVVPGDATDAGRSNVALGYVDCEGATFEWGTSPIYAGVAALYEDGSEDPVGRQPVLIQPPSTAVFPQNSFGRYRRDRVEDYVRDVPW